MSATPFVGVVPDLMMVDRDQAQLFDALGRTRSPFQGVGSWPWLHQLFAERSQELLDAEGLDAWYAAGGQYDEDGHPSLGPSSPLADQAIREVAEKPGGLLWHDEDGVGWAVRLLRGFGGDQHLRFGLAINWNGSGMLLDPQARDNYQLQLEGHLPALAPTDLEVGRRQLERVAKRLWLFERAEQLLLAIHLQVRMQRRSVVLMPDEYLGQLVWGGDRRKRPKDWRGDLFQILRSLTQLRSEVLSLATAGWRPRPSATSVAIAHVELVEAYRRRGEICRPACPYWFADVEHNHFLIQVGHGFLGVLEQFATTDDQQGLRSYDFDFNRPLDTEAKEIVKEARNSGRMLEISVPTKLFGAAKWSGLGNSHRRIIQALVKEVTRVTGAGSRGTGRPDKAYVVTGGRVTGDRPNQIVNCPLLQSDGRYVVFGGNGDRRGKGYQLVGQQRTGWLAKCGYDLPEGNQSMGPVLREFLHDLSEVSQRFDLVVVGYVSSGPRWLTLANIMEMSSSPEGRRQLDRTSVRIYGPDDYLDRLRDYFADRGGFSAIPAPRP